MTDDIQRAIYLIGYLQGRALRCKPTTPEERDEAATVADLIAATLAGLARADEVIEASRDIVATQRRFDDALAASARTMNLFSLPIRPIPAPLLTAAMHDHTAARALHKAAIERYDRHDGTGESGS